MRYAFLALTLVFGIIGIILISVYPDNAKMTATGAMSLVVAITMRWLGGEKDEVYT